MANSPKSHAAGSPYLPQHSEWFRPARPKPVPCLTPMAEAFEKSMKQALSQNKSERIKNNSAIVSRKLKEFEKVLEKSYRRDRLDNKEKIPTSPSEQNTTAPLNPQRTPRPKDRSCIYNVNMSLPDYDSAFNPLKNPQIEPLTAEEAQLESWGKKKATRRMLKAYNPFIVPLPKMTREATTGSIQSLPQTKRSHGFIPLSPSRYLTYRLPSPRGQDESQARPRVSTKRRPRTPLGLKSKPKEDIQPISNTIVPKYVASSLGDLSSKSTFGASDSTKYPLTGTSPSEIALSTTVGCLAPPSTTTGSSENLRKKLKTPEEQQGGGDVDELAKKPHVDSEGKKKGKNRRTRSNRSQCGSSIAGSESGTSCTSRASAIPSTLTSNSAPLKGILKKANQSSSEVSISLLSKIGVCTAQPGTREWDRYWEKYDKAIAQFKRTEAMFMKDTKEYREDLEKFRKEAARMAMEDAIFRQSIGLEPRQVHEVMGQPLMGLTTLNGFVFDRNYGPHRPQAFLTSVGTKGVRLELDLRGYEPDEIKIQNEFNLMKVHIPPDDPQEPTKTIVIGMASDYSVTDMEVYPIVNGWLVIEAADKKHILNNQ